MVEVIIIIATSSQCFKLLLSLTHTCLALRSMSAQHSSFETLTLARCHPSSDMRRSEIGRIRFQSQEPLLDAYEELVLDSDWVEMSKQVWSIPPTLALSGKELPVLTPSTVSCGCCHSLCCRARRVPRALHDGDLCDGQASSMGKPRRAGRVVCRDERDAQQCWPGNAPAPQAMTSTH